MSTQELLPPPSAMPQQVAQGRFSRAVVLARELVSAEIKWVALASLLTEMERSGDLEVLGYRSLNSCIEAIKVQSGYSRSTMHGFVKLYKAISEGGIEVPPMKQGTAHVYKQLPASIKTDPEIVKAVSCLKPDKFEEKIRLEHPELLFESPKVVKFSYSQREKIQDGIEMFRTMHDDEKISTPEAIEGIVQSWVELMEALARGNAEKQEDASA